MNWIQRYRIRSFLRNAVWFFPTVGMLMAIIIHRITRWIDVSMGWQAAVTTDGARALLGALSSAMFTFIVFVFSILLLSVQLASAQLTPRIIALFYRNPVLKFSLTVFVFSFTYSLAVLFRINESVPQICLWIAVYSNLVCIVIFLFMIDHVGKSLRPISLLNLIGTRGQKVIMDVYPKMYDELNDLKNKNPEIATDEFVRIVAAERTGVVLAFDKEGLMELANHCNCRIELVPQVGDFIAYGDPIFRLNKGEEVLPERLLHQKIAIGTERTLEQDPGFAFRIIVDIASKALSPAINDPTTAVLAIDQIHRLLRTISTRQLNTGCFYDKDKNLRFIYRTPDWEDFLNLAITEIRQYGKDSLQVTRRLKAMLENLEKSVSYEYKKSILDELEVLSRSVEREFKDTKDVILAKSADSLGVGGAR